MATIVQKQINNTGKFLKTVIAAAALSACGFAQAGVVNVNFEGDAPPFFFAGSYAEIDNYWIETYGGTQTNDFAGLILDGSDPTACSNGIVCPTNNSSRYYASLNDNYLYFGLANNDRFTVKSLQASFIGAGQTYPAVSGILLLQGYNANGTAAGGSLQLALAGPTNGSFRFADYNLGAFGNTQVSYVRILGYACDATGACNRSGNLANFAVDNIILNEVPEPVTLGLFGLGLAGLALSRRRSV